MVSAKNEASHSYGILKQDERVGSLSSELGVSDSALPAGSRRPQPHQGPAPVEVTTESMGTEGARGHRHPPSHWGTSRARAEGVQGDSPGVGEIFALKCPSKTR